MQAPFKPGDLVRPTKGNVENIARLLRKRSGEEFNINEPIKILSCFEDGDWYVTFTYKDRGEHVRYARRFELFGPTRSKEELLVEKINFLWNKSDWGVKCLTSSR